MVERKVNKRKPSTRRPSGRKITSGFREIAFAGVGSLCNVSGHAPVKAECPGCSIEFCPECDRGKGKLCRKCERAT